MLIGILCPTREWGKFKFKIGGVLLNFARSRFDRSLLFAIELLAIEPIDGIVPITYRWRQPIGTVARAYLPLAVVNGFTNDFFGGRQTLEYELASVIAKGCHAEGLGFAAKIVGRRIFHNHVTQRIVHDHEFK